MKALGTAIAMLGLLALASPRVNALEITAISPEPLISGSMAQLSGGPFDESDLVIRLHEEVQTLQMVQEGTVLFQVAETLPLGPATLEVETGGESIEVAVVISAPPPTIGSVNPQPAIMGQPATVVGTDLGGVVAVRLNDVLCEVTAQTDFQLAFVVPLSGELMGTATLLLETSDWSAQTDIQVKAPTPSIDALSPNPIRQGDLLTILGTIIPSNLAVSVGDQDAEVFSASVGEVIVQVPEDLETGPVDVLVHLGEISSEAAGPLHVQAASSKRPDIDRVAPSNLTHGGSIWLFGDEMEDVDWASDGLWVGDCDDRACRVTPEDPELGQLHGAVGSADGVDTFTVTVLADTLIVPNLVSVEPQPAFRGEELTLHGTDLHQVNAVYVGGLEQTVDHVDVGEVRITLDPATPMGAERVMVAGGSASNALLITVLEPLPGQDPDGGADVQDDTNPPEDVGPDTPDTALGDDVVDADVSTGGEGGASSDGGCRGGPTPRGLLPLMGLLFVFWRRRG